MGICMIQVSGENSSYSGSEKSKHHILVNIILALFFRIFLLPLNFILQCFKSIKKLLHKFFSMTQFSPTRQEDLVKYCYMYLNYITSRPTSVSAQAKLKMQVNLSLIFIKFHQMQTIEEF